MKALIVDDLSGAPLPGASALVLGTTLAATADASGRVEIGNIPPGTHEIRFSFVGYGDEVIRLDFPSQSAERVVIRLHSAGEALEEIVVTATRSTRTIADLPTRVELIAGEELDEKGNMKPGDIRMLLNESTGIQTQLTSATSGNASIRIQGLDGRYTQILKDGFPLYAGFSGGLGLLQTPPLDLRQVEVIKGSTSTLYGGGAIAGLVNLVSRVPSRERDVRLLANATTAKGLDLSAFYGEKYGKAGMTLYASRNSNGPYAPGNVPFTAIPKFERYSVNPRFFLDPDDQTHLTFGVNYISEDRLGGDINYVEGAGSAVHRYFEGNRSTRYSTQFSFARKLRASGTLNVRNSFNHFDRLISIPGYRFSGTQQSTFSELNIASNRNGMEWVGGLNLVTDHFDEKPLAAFPLRDYTQLTFGAFIQNSAILSEAFHLESGLRGDYVADYGFVLLPRVSLLFRPSRVFSARAGGGFGYKAPNVFTEESERIQYRNVMPVSPGKNSLEKSYGVNADANYRAVWGNSGFSVNQLFFYTQLRNPLILSVGSDGSYEFRNSPGYTDSRGAETNLKFEWGDFRLFIGYTFTDALLHEGVETVRSHLTSRHRLNNILMYEVEDKWKVGLEAYYFSPQRLTDNTTGRDYWICGLMAERIFGKISVFLNFENFLDTRQSRFDTIYTGTVSEPVFRDIYAPLDGFVVNGGVKFSH